MGICLREQRVYPVTPVVVWAKPVTLKESNRAINSNVMGVLIPQTRPVTKRNCVIDGMTRFGKIQESVSLARGMLRSSHQHLRVCCIGKRMLLDSDRLFSMRYSNT